jgi:hypothetical protein
MPNNSFTPEEQSVLQYHRNNIAGKTYMSDPDGNITTFRGAVVGLPQGETIIPTYWHGQVRDVPEAVRFAIQSGIKWPSYKTPEAALAREKALHDVMEADITAMRKK